jgi:hypothetical protein
MRFDRTFETKNVIMTFCILEQIFEKRNPCALQAVGCKSYAASVTTNSEKSSLV